MIRFFLLISILATLGSCARKHLVPLEYAVTNKKTLSNVKHLMNVEGDSLKSYSTTVDVYGKYFSGVSYVKNMQDSSLRVLFTTHTGMKLLDLELINNSCNTKYVVEQMDNQIVLKLLCHDFTLLTGGVTKELHANEIQSTSDGAHVATVKGDKDLYYYVSKEGVVTKIIETVPTKNKIQTVLQYKEDSTIQVKHYNFKFELNFKTLNKN